LPVFTALKVFDEYRSKYPQLLTVRQAAEICQRPVKTVYHWSHTNVLDSCKLRHGREIRIVRDCFLTLLMKGID
jgi:hypothetical protein